MKTTYTAPTLTEMHLSPIQMLAVSGPEAGGSGNQGDHGESRKFWGFSAWEEEDDTDDTTF